MPARQTRSSFQKPRRRLPSQERLRLLHRVYKDGVPVAQACRSFGVSRFTFYRWAKRYRRDSSDQANIGFLSDRFRRGRSHYRGVSSKVERDVLELVRRRPELSIHKIAEITQGIGSYGVQVLLERLHLTGRKDREKFAQLSQVAFERFLRREGVGVRRYFSPEERLAVVRRVVDTKEPVLRVCQAVGISRFTFYQWLRQYKRDPTVEGLENRWASGRHHYRAIPEIVERRILDVVLQNPRLSSHKLAEQIAGVSNYGVQKILERQELNTIEKRRAWVATQPVPAVPAVRPELGWLNRVKLVFEQFLPGRAPAPPPQVPFGTWLRRSSPYLLFSFLILFGLFGWGRLLGSAESTGQGIGFFFASIALS
ncbi:transposase, partial [Patescibacteria group bacterium]|nr:transposase [Patescibacteria group bacterium]